MFTHPDEQNALLLQPPFRNPLSKTSPTKQRGLSKGSEAQSQPNTIVRAFIHELQRSLGIRCQAVDKWDEPRGQKGESRAAAPPSWRGWCSPALTKHQHLDAFRALGFASPALISTHLDSCACYSLFHALMTNYLGVLLNADLTPPDLQDLTYNCKSKQFFH